MRAGDKDGICFRDMSHTALQIDRESNPIKRIQVKEHTSIENGHSDVRVGHVSSACCQDRRKGGSGPRSDPEPVPHSCTGRVGTWRLRRRFRGRMILDARQLIPYQEGIQNRCSLHTGLDVGQ